MLMSHARDLYAREEFERCEAVCRSILQGDPTNVSAKILQNRAREKKHGNEERRTFSESRYQRRQSMLDMSRASIPHSGGIVYPDNWDAVKSRAE